MAKEMYPIRINENEMMPILRVEPMIRATACDCALYLWYRYRCCRIRSRFRE